MSQSTADRVEKLMEDLIDFGSDNLPIRTMEKLLAVATAAVRPLAELLQFTCPADVDPDEDLTQMSAAVLLGELRDPSVAPVLADTIRRSRARELHLPVAAAAALAALGAPALPLLHSLAGAEAAHHRLWAYYAASRLRTPESYDFLLEALKSDHALVHAIGLALADHRDTAAIEPLYRALAAAEPWQRRDLEAAILRLHHGTGADPGESPDWRVRYRLNPMLGWVPIGWAVIAALTDPTPLVRDRLAIPLRKLEDILADAPPRPDQCECCGVPMWSAAGAPVCPRTAAWIPGLQAHVLRKRSEEGGEDDIFDMLEYIECELVDMEEEPPPTGWQEQQRRKHRRNLFRLMQRGAIWAVEHGAETVDAACALLLEEAALAARRYGDPMGILRPTRAQA